MVIFGVYMDGRRRGFVMRFTCFLLLLSAVLGLVLLVPAGAQVDRRSDFLFEPWNASGRGSNSAGDVTRSGFFRQPLSSVERSDAARSHAPELDITRSRSERQTTLRQVVSYPTREAPGTIVIDTGSTSLYLVLGDNKAIQYSIGVGRQGFTWAGRERISRKAEWPDWRPSDDMIARDPHLPRYMPGGLHNPLGARALYLGNTLYRIHGTNQPSSIGTFESSGCFRMLNEDVIDLYQRVSVGAPVVVLDHTDVAIRASGRRSQRP
jgi:lipoprotein-anchoring transpeptidase ErfK/SrfK